MKIGTNKTETQKTETKKSETQKTSLRNPFDSPGTVFLAFLLLLLFAGSGFAAEPGSSDAIKNSENTLKLPKGVAGPAAEIQDLAWMAGYWVGEGLGGQTEEMWTPPVGDRMHGVFTLRQDGDITFTESMIFVEKEGSLVLRLKHFDADFVGWEEKDGTVDFRLVKTGENEAYFNGLTFRRDKDQLLIYLVLNRGGERSEEKFVMQRTDL